MMLMRKTWVALALLFRFLYAVIVSGLDTVRIILRASVVPGATVQAGFFRVSFAPMSAQGAALLGCMVSLTPGTTTLDIDLSQRQLLLHVLDGSDPQAVLDSIRQNFEPSLVLLFGSDA